MASFSPKGWIELQISPEKLDSITRSPIKSPCASPHLNQGKSDGRLTWNGWKTILSFLGWPIFRAFAVSFREVNPTVKCHYNFVQKMTPRINFVKMLLEYVPEFYHIRHIFGKDTTPTDMSRYLWVFPKIVGFPPKTSILIGFSIWGTPILGNTHISKTHPIGQVQRFTKKQNRVTAVAKLKLPSPRKRMDQASWYLKERLRCQWSETWFP